MSYITRTLGNIRKIGIKEYWHQLQYIGDTKAGVLMGTDKFGNKYYENNDELPLRTRWVDYAKHDFDPSQIEPLWHMWISYGTDKLPSEDLNAHTKRSWANPANTPNFTATRGAFKTYSTVKPKIQSWEPIAAPRQ
ncbi:NADH ubiquinone oxidoreductase subunit NDUFA12-domain-containing protein [Apodospora peruviana]|uniref:NADH dehydrogenase [ubiquinone] 1 alpha subcomplex subunit n=1 Tax=Apodospora peruviana TaxID=516989 RepID=A0AAE0MBU5_9PEZI|nr:NADH ubiquinone oxidoreductase subunit NDUFA12-domain-containing protein [Apodospora peruviana]